MAASAISSIDDRQVFKNASSSCFDGGYVMCPSLKCEKNSFEPLQT